jgi:hypothetical protein
MSIRTPGASNFASENLALFAIALLDILYLTWLIKTLHISYPIEDNYGLRQRPSSALGYRRQAV